MSTIYPEYLLIYGQAPVRNTDREYPLRAPERGFMPTPAQALKEAEEAERLFVEQQKLLDEEAKSAQGGNQVDPPAEGKPVIPEGGEAPKVDPPKSDPPQVEDWKHKYDVLQGKYNKEVPDLSARLNQALQVNASLDTRVRDLETRAVQPPVAGAEDKTLMDAIEKDPSVAFVKTEYPDMWKAVTVAVQNAGSGVKAKVETLEREVEAQKKDNVANRVNRFYDDLDKVENWQVINVSPEFDSWLSETDRYSGKTKRELLKGAYERLDATTVSRFFSDYAAKGESVTAGENAVGDTEQAAAAEVAAAAAKKKVVLPKAAGNSIPKESGSENKPTISAVEVNKFYQDRMRGLWKGREKEMLEREAVIELAVAEGRVR